MGMRAVFLFLFSSISLLSYPDRDARGNYSENFFAMQTKITIESKKQSFREGEDIYLFASVTNTSKEVVRFFPSNKTDDTFRLLIKDEDEQVLNQFGLEEKDRYDSKLKRRTTTEDFSGGRSKEVSLHPGETFTKRIEISKNYPLSMNKTYSVVLFVYPNVLENDTVFHRSANSIFFQILPKNLYKVEESPISSHSSLETDGISPEEVVFLFLAAEKKKNWKEFYKWIQLNEFVLSYDDYSQNFLQANDSDRNVILEDFKKYLQTSPGGSLQFFQLQKKEEDSSKVSRVTVIADRKMGKSTHRYEYVYTLFKEVLPNGYWKIQNVTAKVIRK